MLAAYRLMADTMDREGFNYPLHLGVTEAGDGDYGRIKSTAGIATLLRMVWDPARVADGGPEKEIPFVTPFSSPWVSAKPWSTWLAPAGRTLFNLEEVLHKVRNANHLTGLDIAVMGCIVNGPKKWLMPITAMSARPLG